MCIKGSGVAQNWVAATARAPAVKAAARVLAPVALVVLHCPPSLKTRYQTEMQTKMQTEMCGWSRGAVCAAVIKCQCFGFCERIVRGLVGIVARASGGFVHPYENTRREQTHRDGPGTWHTQQAR